MRHLLTMGALGAALGVDLTGAPARADTGNLLECVDHGFALQKCVLKDVMLSPGIIEDGQAYESQFLVHYDFPCSGHSVQVGVQSSDSNKLFSMGVNNGLVTLNGTGELHPYDPSPTVTKSLTFNPGCSLDVTGVTLLPSTVTAQIWTIQAHTEVRALSAALESYQLAKDWENLSAWNVSKLNLLKSKLTLLVAGDPLNLNYKIMLNTVASALNNQPPSATLDELRQASSDVIATLLDELEQEVAIAQALSDRFARWQLAADQALQEAIDGAANP